MTTNLFPTLLQTLEPQDGINTLYTEAIPLREYPNVVNLGIGHVLVVDNRTEFVRDRCGWLERRVQRERLPNTSPGKGGVQR